MFTINPALAITDSSFILTQPQVTSLSSALRGQNCSLCLCRPLSSDSVYVCVDSRIRVCTCAGPGSQCVHLRVHAHVWCVCAPECVKQTWKHNWRQRCKNRGNTAGQWKPSVRDPPSFLSSLRLPPFRPPSLPPARHWGTGVNGHLFLF